MHNFIAGKMTFLLAFVTTKRNKSDLFFFLAFSTFFRKIEFLAEILPIGWRYMVDFVRIKKLSYVD